MNKKFLIISVVVILGVCTGLVIAPCLQRSNVTIELNPCYPSYDFQSLQEVADLVICGRVVSQEQPRWTHNGEDENIGYYITTDYVIEVTDEDGRYLETIILREDGGKIDDTTMTSSGSIQNYLEVGQTYIFCLAEYPERSGGVTYCVDGEDMTFNTCYKTIAGASSVFCTQNQDLVLNGTYEIQAQNDIYALSGKYGRKHISDFCFSFEKEKE